MTTRALSIFTSSAMLLFVVVPVACAPDVPRPLHEKYVVIDLTRSGVSAPYDGPLPSKATRTFVPWDDTAILEVQPDGDSEGDKDNCQDPQPCAVVAPGRRRCVGGRQ